MSRALGDGAAEGAEAGLHAEGAVGRGLVDAGLAGTMGKAATMLTILSMAALGLGIDLRRVLRAGPRVTAAVVLSLGVLVVASYAMVLLLNLATA